MISTVKFEVDGLAMKITPAFMPWGRAEEFELENIERKDL